MKKTKKSILLVLCIVALLFSSVLAISSFQTQSVYASAQDFSVEEYTKSDYLLKSDGNESNKSIRVFSEEVKAAKDNTEFPELAEVIPLQYLISQENQAVFSYNGQEYGFYLVKDKEYYDLLLIDFIYEFKDPDYSDLAYTIKIKPLLQQSFVRSVNDDGNYVWKKSDETRNKYYVANPRFMSQVLNENALNYGDNGYSKYNDDGVIINEYRLNYGKVKYATGSDAFKVVLQFGIDQLFGKACEYLNALVPGSKDAIDFIKDTISLGNDLYEAGKETTVLADNENNIKMQMSKASQRDNANIDAYSRMVGVAPQEELLLSAADDSYAEFITCFNDANSRSRLTQYCEFDIMKRKGAFGSPEYVNDVDNGECYAFGKERVLFDDKSVTELDNTVPMQEGFAYFLPNGNVNLTYNCALTHDYAISTSTTLPDVKVFCNGSAVDVQRSGKTATFRMEKGKSYSIVLSQESAGFYNFRFGRKSTHISTYGNVNIPVLKVGEYAWYDYTPSKDRYVSVDYGLENYRLSVYDATARKYVAVDNTLVEKEFLLTGGHTYYLGISSNVDNTSGSKFTFKSADTLTIDSAKNFYVNGEKHFYFTAPVQGLYIIQDKSADLTSVEIGANYNGTAYYLEAGKEYVVTANGTNTQAKFKVTPYSQELRINGGATSGFGNISDSLFIKFTPNLSLNYKLSLPSGAKLTHVMSGTSVSTVTSWSSLSFVAGQTYYLRVETNIKTIYVGISPVLNDTITLDGDGHGAKSVVGNGTAVVKLTVNTRNIYEITCANDFELYNGNLQRLDKSSSLPAGNYYIIFTATSNVTNVEVNICGRLMQQNVSVSVNGDETFRYNLTSGKEYEVRISKAQNSTFTVGVSAKNSLGVACPVTQTGDGVYKFTANGSVMFINLTMRNVGGQAAIFALIGSDEQGVPEILPNIKYDITNGETAYFRISKGSYKLCFIKGTAQTVRLFKVDNNSTNEVNIDEITDESKKQMYNISLSSECTYLIYTDYTMLSYMLTYSDMGKYKLDVTDTQSRNKDLSIYNSYVFSVYTENVEGEIINSVEYTFSVGFGDNAHYEKTNDVYVFKESGTAYVGVDYYGINLNRYFRVIAPDISAYYSMTVEGLYFDINSPFYSSNLGYKFTGMRVTHYSNNQMLEVGSYSTNSKSECLNNYITYPNHSTTVECTYSNGKDSFVMSRTVNYTYNVLSIYNAAELTGMSSMVIDATVNQGRNDSIEIKIPDNIKLIYFVGDGNVFECLDVTINERWDDLTISFINFSYKFVEYGIQDSGKGLGTVNICVNNATSITPLGTVHETKSGLVGGNAISVKNLNIYGDGSLELRAANMPAKYYGMNGLEAIRTSDIIIGVKSLTLVGGSGTNGKAGEGTVEGSLNGNDGQRGGDGGYGITVESALKVKDSCIEIVFVCGRAGNGGRGADGVAGSGNLIKGGDGGRGGDSGQYDSYFLINNVKNQYNFPSKTDVAFVRGVVSNKGSINVIGGDGGNGAIGGRGGDGGHGGDGGNGYVGGVGGNGGDGGLGVKDSSTSGKPSDGGNGGNGGHGGYSYGLKNYQIPGNGGNGGDGGYPGNVGNGTRGGNGGMGYVGGNGGNGSDSWLMFSKGGNGGNGGDGYGSNAGKGGNGGTNKTGPNGSKGKDGTSHSDYQEYKWFTSNN